MPRLIAEQMSDQLPATHRPAAPMPGRTTAAAAAVDSLVEEFASRRPLRAAAFIVTLYGDVVIPRGGSLWVGNVIEACARVGISETLVRTAASRLVAAGRLEGTRVGRLGYYGLTAAARAEFSAAAARLYTLSCATAGDGFTLALRGGEEETAAGPDGLEEAGFVRLGDGLALAPGARPVPAGWAQLSVSPTELTDRPALQAAVRRLWNLAELEAGYEIFIERFSPLAACLSAGASLTDGLSALSARLLLVQGFRELALRDPGFGGLPLPPDWAGERARQLFARLYLALSPATDAHVARFAGLDGPLAGTPSEVLQRQRQLAGLPA